MNDQWLYPLTELERTMKVQEVIMRAIAGKLSWYQAAEILGTSVRSVRRWKAQMEELGVDGLIDRRRRRPSQKKVPLAEVQRVVRLYTDSNGLAVANLGVLELMAGNRDAARAALEHALELDPQVAKAHNTLGVMAAQEGRPAEAIERWKRAVDINPNDYQTLFNLAGTLDRAGRRGEARTYFEAYLRVAPPALEAPDIARVRAWLTNTSG